MAVDDRETPLARPRFLSVIDPRSVANAAFNGTMSVTGEFCFKSAKLALLGSSETTVASGIGFRKDDSRSADISSRIDDEGVLEVGDGREQFVELPAQAAQRDAHIGRGRSDEQIALPRLHADAELLAKDVSASQRMPSCRLPAWLSCLASSMLRRMFIR